MQASSLRTASSGRSQKKWSFGGEEVVGGREFFFLRPSPFSGLHSFQLFPSSFRFLFKVRRKCSVFFLSRGAPEALASLCRCKREELSALEGPAPIRSERAHRSSSSEREKSSRRDREAKRQSKRELVLLLLRARAPLPLSRAVPARASFGSASACERVRSSEESAADEWTIPPSIAAAAAAAAAAAVSPLPLNSTVCSTLSQLSLSHH